MIDLSLLRSFTAGIRAELTDVVAARLAGVLLPGSVERVEYPSSVQRLESALQHSGRDAIVDQVSYTWFNRFIALRFMDVNGYTGVGVVSPAGGAPTGQPEILADAKAGYLDTELVTETTRNQIIGLLAGDVTSPDPQGEAYRLLLAAYCHYWAGPMPFMFDRSGDFTELLVPEDLLSDRSIVARIVQTLTPEACTDVEVIGWIYQFYIAARKDDVFAGFKNNKKATAQDIPAATQLFTPHWIVKYLVENSLGRLWQLNNPNSNLAEHMEYYIAPLELETNFLTITSPEQLKVLDPACGSGHMLTYAFDLLYLMYEESGYAPSDIPKLILQNNLYGTEIDSRAGALAAFALTMKARGKQKTFFNPKNSTTPNICVLAPIHFTPDELETLATPVGPEPAESAFWQAFENADLYGSLIRPDQDLIEPMKAQLQSLYKSDTLFGNDVVERARTVIWQAEYLSTQYHVVVANPPYMGAKNMSSQIVSFLGDSYPYAKADFFSAFMVRSTELALPKGQLGFMTPYVWMFISSYKALRSKVNLSHPLTTLTQLEYSGFEGATVPICIFTMHNAPAPALKGAYIKLSDFKGASNQPIKTLEAIRNPSCGWFYAVSAEEFKQIPGNPIAYWAAPGMFDLFQNGQLMSDFGDTRKGMATGLNDKFVRHWHEVSFSKIGFEHSRETAKASKSRWFPYASGGAYRRWYGNFSEIVNWENDGIELQTERTEQGGRIRAVNLNLDYVFKPGITWTSITSGHFSARYLPKGFLFSSAANAFFSAKKLNPILGILNSGLSRRVMQLLNPTLNANPGDIGRIPVSDKIDAIDSKVSELVSLAKLDWDSFETSWDFQNTDVLKPSNRHAVFRMSARNVLDIYLEREEQVVKLEAELNGTIDTSFGMLTVADSGADTTLLRNSRGNLASEFTTSPLSLFQRNMEEFVSYAVGCIFGRYSLDVPGLILADQGDSLADYKLKVPVSSFMPDKDNVVPILSDSWFEDDIVERLHEFLKVSFGVENFEENLRFVEESLGKDLRRYFLQDFYRDHVQRYKKRPIYWMFSSPKGSFNALIYMHRYRPDTASVVLNDYLHEFQEKLRSRRGHVDQVMVSSSSTAKAQTAARKESEQIRKMLLELEDWEQGVLYPLATEQIQIDLDDGVKANYPKFGGALNTKYTGF